MDPWELVSGSTSEDIWGLASGSPPGWSIWSSIRITTWKGQWRLASGSLPGAETNPGEFENYVIRSLASGSLPRCGVFPLKGTYGAGIWITPFRELRGLASGSALESHLRADIQITNWDNWDDSNPDQSLEGSMRADIRINLRRKLWGLASGSIPGGN
jgi:hypothetical protein